MLWHTIQINQKFITKTKPVIHFNILLNKQSLPQFLEINILVEES